MSIPNISKKQIIALDSLLNAISSSTTKEGQLHIDSKERNEYLKNVLRNIGFHTWFKINFNQTNELENYQWKRRLLFKNLNDHEEIFILPSEVGGHFVIFQLPKSVYDSKDLDEIFEIRHERIVKNAKIEIESIRGRFSLSTYNIISEWALSFES